MPRLYHYPTRMQRQQRAIVAAQHAQVVQTTSAVTATATAVASLEEAVGGDLSALTETVTEVGVLAAELEQRVSQLESAI